MTRKAEAATDFTDTHRSEIRKLPWGRRSGFFLDSDLCLSAKSVARSLLSTLFTLAIPAIPTKITATCVFKLTMTLRAHANHV
jgi:hypothetical protein